MQREKERQPIHNYQKKDRVYLCIDLKSFYASVECAERGLDPFTTNLVVADPERTDKTICLAVTPAMKALGVPNRCRVFEIPKNIDYIMAPPRMRLYIDYSAEIYSVYLEFLAKEDIYPYSIDEMFMDVTDYLSMYGMSAVELGRSMMRAVYERTGITSSCGVGTNLYLTKIALDITAKHSPDRIGYLDEEIYRRTLWDHTPLTDFWRIGKGTQRRLNRLGIYTMREIAGTDEDILYREFGIDAELLIDHAWGREPVTLADIQNYRPKETSITSGQVLPRDYDYREGEIILTEMCELLTLELVDIAMYTDHISLHVGYSRSAGVPSLHVSEKLPVYTCAVRTLREALLTLYHKNVKKNAPIRRVSIGFGHLTDTAAEQYNFFIDPAEEARDRKLSQVTVSLRKRFGKNAVLKGTNLDAAGTTIERNAQIGGHRSGD